MPVHACRLLAQSLLRIGGTIAGAALAFFAMRWIGYNHIACYAFLLSFTKTGLLGFQVSESNYAWLLSAVTASIVVLSSLEDPRLAFHIAVYRAAEVVIGTLTAFLVTQALSPQEEAPPAIAAPGWSDLFGAQWPATLHALRSGVTVTLIPLIWFSFDFPPIGAQMGVSAVIVTAVPVLGVSSHALMQKLVERVQHRLFGCFVGDAAALLVLAWPVTEFLPWLLILGAAVWVATYVQSSAQGVGYIGTQFGMVFIMTLGAGLRAADEHLGRGRPLRRHRGRCDAALPSVGPAMGGEPPAQAETNDHDKRARAALREKVFFWVFLVGLLALVAVVLAVARPGG